MPDVPNEICISDEAVRGKTLQGGEVCTAFLQRCGKNLLWAVMEARSSNLWTSTPPHSQIHRPSSCPFLQAAQRFSLLKGGILEHCSVVHKEGSGLCTWSTCVVQSQKFPALLEHCICVQKAEKTTKSSPPLNTMKSLR